MLFIVELSVVFSVEKNTTLNTTLNSTNLDTLLVNVLDLSLVITITTRDIFQYLLPGVEQFLNVQYVYFEVSCILVKECKKNYA